MGHFTFKWEHPANEVYVTGTFDGWSRSVKLERNASGTFEKSVDLPEGSTVYYKFVVDGNWVTNDTAPGENDASGNYNNVLFPHDIQPGSVHTLSSAAPQSSTAALAGQVPKESEKVEEHVPGAFPETPAFESTEQQTFGVNPLPATDGPGNPISLRPGEPVPDPSTFTSNTITSTVKNDDSIKNSTREIEQTFGVSPIPATSGAGNPVDLKPGEPVPDSRTLTGNTINSTVKLDEASYNRADSPPPTLPPVMMTPEPERAATGGLFHLPDLTKGTIPESSLPMGTSAATEKDPGFTIQSAHPQSTTAQLAGQVPLEPRGVPTTVIESQKEAHVYPEAAANPEAVLEKKEVEQELLSEVPEKPATTESGLDISTVAGAAAGAAVTAAAAIGAAATSAFSTAKEKAPGAAAAAQEKAAETAAVVQAKTVDTTAAAQEKAAETAAAVQAKAADATTAVQEKVHPVVQQSIDSINASASVPEPVKNVINSVAPVEPSAPPTSTATGATVPVPDTVKESHQRAHEPLEAAANPVALAEKSAMESELEQKVDRVAAANGGPTGVTVPIPEPVKKSIETAHKDPEAVANPAAVAQWSAVEHELAQKVRPTDEAADPPPTLTAATSAVAPGDGPAPASATRSTGATGGVTVPVPDAVQESIDKSQRGPEAAANPVAVAEKAAMERELEQKVPLNNETADPAPTGEAFSPYALNEPLHSSSEVGESGAGLNAPASKPAQSLATETGELASNPQPTVAPANTGVQTQPVVTSGTETRAIESQSSGPAVVSAAEPTQPVVITPGAEAPTTTTEAESRLSSSKSPTRTSSKQERRRSGFFGKKSTSPSPSPDSRGGGGEGVQGQGQGQTEAEEKKKRRISGFFGKLREKLK